MDEVSPQMIVQMIVAAKQLTQLATIPLLLDHGQRDLADSKVWRLLQNSTAKPTSWSDPAIDPINIVKDMGFPCVTHLFRLSRGKDSHDATSILSNFTSAGLASDEEHRNCETHHAYLQCLFEYICYAERAITSAQVLRELVRRSENTVQSLRIEYENDIENLKKHAPPPSTVRHHIQVNVDKEMTLLLHSLNVLFECTQNMIDKLKEH
jgi:hypothetical protein